MGLRNCLNNYNKLPPSCEQKFPVPRQTVKTLSPSIQLSQSYRIREIFNISNNINNFIEPPGRITIIKSFWQKLVQLMVSELQGAGNDELRVW